MNVSSKQLRGFLLVAKLRSFSRAAEQIHLTQAGVSSLIRDLEAQFNCRLFDRSTRSVSLTPEGQSLLGPAERILHDLEAAAMSVKASAEQTRRLLTIAVTPISGAALIPLVCREFAQIDPSMEIRVQDVPQPTIQQLVERGDVDLGFSIFMKPTGGIALRSLLEFQLVCVAPVGCLRAMRLPARNSRFSTLAWSDIPDLPLVSLPAHLPPQQFVDPYLKVAGVARRRVVYNSMQTIIAMVAAGQGIAILPSMVIPACPADQFDVARMVDPDISLPFYQISKKGHLLSPGAELFVDTMVSVVNRVCES